MKNELEIEKAKERKCAEELENPENDKRWRELEGEDPEQEALEAKIQVLEERLNYKKECPLFNLRITWERVNSWRNHQSFRKTKEASGGGKTVHFRTLGESQ